MRGIRIGKKGGESKEIRDMKKGRIWRDREKMKEREKEKERTGECEKM